MKKRHYRRAKVKPLEFRFWDSVFLDNSDKCWMWDVGKTGCGYGAVVDQGKTLLAHRVSHQQMNGVIPNGHYIDHTCRVRSCVNPSHLRAVTNKQNQEHRPRESSFNHSSGIRGVVLDKKAGRWKGQVKHNGHLHYLGYFDTIEEAAEVVRLKRLELYTHNDLDRDE